MSETQNGIAADGTGEGANVAKGCGAVVLVVVIVLWLLIRVATGTDHDAVARTQYAAIVTNHVIQTDGGSFVDSICETPAGQREERVRQLVDLWFSLDKPMHFPTEGQDADWLERDSARGIVKRKIVEMAMRDVNQRCP